MKTAVKNNTKTIRVNFTLPLYLYSELKKTLPERKMSEFVADTLNKSLWALKSKKFINKNFASIDYKGKNPTAYLKEIDELENKKLKKLWGFLLSLIYVLLLFA